ncbi:MAG: peptidase T [Candidatus Coproplasma sp.]
MERVEEKFLRYVKIDTPSNEENYSVTPSTECQHALAKVLYDELRSLGIKAKITPNAYVYGEIEANCPATAAVGFIAHIDVVDKPKGFGVNPQVHEYVGGDLYVGNGVKITLSDCPGLANYVGQKIITSDGTTILGADDKAGVAEIMALAEYLATNPQVKHGKVCVAFTPDEEIGHGAKLFDVAGFGCDFAFTVDGEELGELCYETFNGAAFCFEIEGVNIHPGQAKGKMINAVAVANEIFNRFPAEERPENTEGREGYYFFNEIRGDVEKCVLSGIIRDHDRSIFNARKEYVKEVAKEYSSRYGGRVKLTLKDQYYNCAEVIAPHAHIIDNAVKAMEKEGVTPIISPIRGGTDGSSLSFMGLPCPNICTGGHNAHGKNEFVPVGSMNTIVRMLLNIVYSYVK